VIAWITGNAPSVDEQNTVTLVDDPAVLGGRYELGALLGTGASAVVRRAVDRETGRPFAVKLFHAGASAHDRRRQQREMRALAALHHPGLVGLHDGGVEAGRPYIVTDLVEGPTLAELVAEGPLQPAQVRQIGARLADALAHVHAGGIVHRDLKPANVLLGSDGRPRLADFGIARALDGTAVTGAGYVVGTAAYLAPEQVRGEWVGPEADVYALGLVLLESLTGRREYPGALVESATARLHRAPGIPDDLPSALRTALHTMTALDPAVRPTAADVATLLRSGASRRDRGRRFGRGQHRRSDGRPATAPRSVGLVAALAAAAAITAATLPSSQPQTTQAAPGVPPHPVVPTPQGAAVPWALSSAVVPVDRVASSLGDGADAARRRAAAVAKVFSFHHPPRQVRTGEPRHAADTSERRSDDDRSDDD
jgi:hypothetical protein